MNYQNIKEQVLQQAFTSYSLYYCLGNSSANKVVPLETSVLLLHRLHYEKICLAHFKFYNTPQQGIIKTKSLTGTIFLTILYKLYEYLP